MALFVRISSIRLCDHGSSVYTLHVAICCCLLCVYHNSGFIFFKGASGVARALSRRASVYQALCRPIYLEQGQLKHVVSEEPTCSTRSRGYGCRSTSTSHRRRIASGSRSKTAVDSSDSSATGCEFRCRSTNRSVGVSSGRNRSTSYSRTTYSSRSRSGGSDICTISSSTRSTRRHSRSSRSNISSTDSSCNISTSKIRIISSRDSSSDIKGVNNSNGRGRDFRGRSTIIRKRSHQGSGEGHLVVRKTNCRRNKCIATLSNFSSPSSRWCRSVASSGSSSRSNEMRRNFHIFLEPSLWLFLFGSVSQQHACRLRFLKKSISQNNCRNIMRQIKCIISVCGPVMWTFPSSAAAAATGVSSCAIIAASLAARRPRSVAGGLAGSASAKAATALFISLDKRFATYRSNYSCATARGAWMAVEGPVSTSNQINRARPTARVPQDVICAASFGAPHRTAVVASVKSQGSISPQRKGKKTEQRRCYSSLYWSATAADGDARHVAAGGIVRSTTSKKKGDTETHTAAQPATTTAPVEEEAAVAAAARGRNSRASAATRETAAAAASRRREMLGATIAAAHASRQVYTDSPHNAGGAKKITAATAAKTLAAARKAVFDEKESGTEGKKEGEGRKEKGVKSPAAVAVSWNHFPRFIRPSGLRGRVCFRSAAIAAGACPLAAGTLAAEAFRTRSVTTLAATAERTGREEEKGGRRPGGEGQKKDGVDAKQGDRAGAFVEEGKNEFFRIGKHLMKRRSAGEEGTPHFSVQLYDALTQQPISYWHNIPLRYPDVVREEGEAAVADGIDRETCRAAACVVEKETENKKHQEKQCLDSNFRRPTSNSTSRNNELYSMVVEIPKYSRRKYEIQTKLPFNPIQQDITSQGELREYPGAIYWNYGALPQTWEDPRAAPGGENVDNLPGDGDPVDVIEIGSSVCAPGSVIPVKVLGAFALIDSGSMDWKMLTVRRGDPLFSVLDDVHDVEQQQPFIVSGVREWFRWYKTPTTAGILNVFGHDEQPLNAPQAKAIIEATHRHYLQLRRDKTQKTQRVHQQQQQWHRRTQQLQQQQTNMVGAGCKGVGKADLLIQQLWLPDAQMAENSSVTAARGEERDVL